MDLNTRLTNLEARTALLQRSARRWRWATCALAAVLGVGILGAARQNAPTADVLRAESLEIVNAQGDVMLSLNQDEFGGLLGVYNTKGERVASVEVNSTGGLMTVADKNGDIRAAAQSDAFGGMFVVFGTSNMKAAAIECHDLGGLVSVCDEEGTPLSAMDVSEQGGRVVINGPGDNAAVVLARDNRGTGLAFINNAEGDQVFLAGANDAGDGMVNTYDSNGKPLITLGSTGREALLSVFNNRGGEAVQLGVTAGEGRVEVRDRNGNKETLRP